MELRFIRNATLRFRYAGRTILGDPMLDDVAAWFEDHGMPSPTVALPVTIEELLDGVEAVVVTHTHLDHFDHAARERLPKRLPLFAQPPDRDEIAGHGFADVRPVADSVEWEGVTIDRIGGAHGLPPVGIAAGPVSGFVLRAPGEPTVYWCGDTILCDEVRDAIARFDPDVVITHSGGAAPEADGGPIIMDIDQTLATVRAAPRATIVAIHLEALPHCSVSRAALRAVADRRGIPASRLLIPADGETFVLDRRRA